MKVVIQRENFEDVMEAIKDSKKDRRVSGIIIYDNRARPAMKKYVEIVGRK